MRTTTTDVFVERRSKGTFICRPLRSERSDGHDHAVDAESALCCPRFDEGLLDRVQMLGCPEALWGRDIGAVAGVDGDLA